MCRVGTGELRALVPQQAGRIILSVTINGYKLLNDSNIRPCLFSDSKLQLSVLFLAVFL